MNPSTETSVADDLLRSGYDRWLRLEEEKTAIGEDLKELFAELKGNGFLNTKAVRAAFRRQHQSEDAQKVAADEAFEAEVDMIRASIARDARVRAA